MVVESKKRKEEEEEAQNIPASVVVKVLAKSVSF